ncbi:MAG: DUF4832 domain-containing protein [Bacteroidales bacterium]|nr:DUF4832 domain-containing protein [Bacteroidales bacterium]
MKLIHLILMGLAFLSITQPAVAQQSADANEEGRGAYKTRTMYNMEKYWDSEIVCKNPHKGWELHFFDNGISQYGTRLKPDDYLEDFPGLSNIYLRLGWSYLEPEEGKYNWQIIDTVIDRWVAHGYKISFRITCKETDNLIFATPKWVMQAGAKGSFPKESKSGNWAPDYGDPIFLEKLENFHKAFAARYAHKSWLEYIDIGSIGEWGEGHTSASGWYDVPVWVVKKHIEMYRRCYPDNVLILSDDYMGQRNADDGADDEILACAMKNHLGFRDDSSCVNWYAKLGFGYSTIRSPEIFNLVWDNIPVVLESEHYSIIKRNDFWDNGKRFEKGIEETHASFISFHHWPREWLSENPELAKRLANKCGYWYFPKYAVLPDTLRKYSTHNYLRMTWENHGVAPAYHHYDLRLQLTDQVTGKQTVLALTESNNRTWMPERIVGEEYTLNLPATLESGKYDIKIGLFDPGYGEEIAIRLALKPSRRSADGYYKLGEIIVR